ncbi:ABC transporter ATP-binding protein [bacterium D16-54]|nr:ABC transporter ATP-binding protein [bacterium D16-54]RKJ13770.1 ABC transporter ATP-binding protein [bacterium D16-56]
MISLRNIEKTYSNFNLHCDLRVKENRITALIGPNGAGKSTTFKIILGLIRPEGGWIELFGKRCEAVTAQNKAQMGVVLSDSCFSGYLKIKDIIPVLAEMYTEFNKKDFIGKCEKWELPFDKKLKEFSTGMKAKLKVLSAMSHNARLLILDEPTAGLDVLARDDILDMMREYMIPGDRSILISSHISKDLEELCDDFYLIDKGRLMMHEETDVLIDHYGIIKVTEEQYHTLDLSYCIRKKREPYGFCLLTDQKQFYQENASELTIERCNIDNIMYMMIKGDTI